MIAALMNAKTSGPRGDLAFKNRHYVAMTTYLVQEQKDGIGKARRQAASDHPAPGEPDLLAGLPQRKRS